MSLILSHNDSSETHTKPIRFCVSRDGQGADVLIQVVEFTVRGVAAVLCHVTIISCCLDYNEIKDYALSAAAETCRATFGDGRWIYGEVRFEPGDHRASRSQKNQQPHCMTSQLLEEHVARSDSIQGHHERAPPAKRRRLLPHTEPATSTDKGPPTIRSNPVGPDSFYEKLERGAGGLINSRTWPGAAGVVYPEQNEELQNVRDMYPDEPSERFEKLCMILDSNTGTKSYDRSYLSRLWRDYVVTYCEAGRGTFITDLQTGGRLRRQSHLSRMLSDTVNRLALSWGVYAKLVFAFMAQTRYMASEWRNKDTRCLVRETVQRMETWEKVTVPQDLSVPDPAVFLSCMLKVEYSDVCTRIGLENLQQFNPKAEIDANSERLKTLGLRCGTVPLSKLHCYGNLRLETHDNNRTVTIYLQKGSQGCSGSYSGLHHVDSTQATSVSEILNLHDTASSMDTAAAIIGVGPRSRRPLAEKSLSPSSANRKKQATLGQKRCDSIPTQLQAGDQFAPGGGTTAVGVSCSTAGVDTADSPSTRQSSSSFPCYSGHIPIEDDEQHDEIVDSGAGDSNHIGGADLPAEEKSLLDWFMKVGGYDLFPL
ncbi:hypothetical protein PCL_07406 [Purpureocillium lilacinum]|uniref:Uncharacterized protein n=1 Tax=Purpureocillium lilacinum TaxID=33203 RepID=A0A2U3DS78_PURLI|nr:hypothetical protein PCL_07406 [Purpureocillium lilacinum]